MTNTFKSLALAILLSVALPAGAQDSTTADTATENPEPNADTGGLSLGEVVSPDNQIGRTYTRATYSDWELRCVLTEDGKDPCQMYQLLMDQVGNPVAEINLFPLESGGLAVAGATIVTPLETLLTEQITMQIDDKASKRYPFSWCSQIGCFARIGFTGEELQSLKDGAMAKVSIVPVAAANQNVVLTMSLAGFTAAFKGVNEAIEAIEN